MLAKKHHGDVSERADTETAAKGFGAKAYITPPPIPMSAEAAPNAHKKITEKKNRLVVISQLKNIPTVYRKKK